MNSLKIKPIGNLPISSAAPINRLIGRLAGKNVDLYNRLWPIYAFESALLLFVDLLMQPIYVWLILSTYGQTRSIVYGMNLGLIGILLGMLQMYPHMKFVLLPLLGVCCMQMLCAAVIPRWDDYSTYSSLECDLVDGVEEDIDIKFLGDMITEPKYSFFMSKDYYIVKYFHFGDESRNCRKTFADKQFINDLKDAIDNNDKVKSNLLISMCAIEEEICFYAPNYVLTEEGIRVRVTINSKKDVRQVCFERLELGFWDIFKTFHIRIYSKGNLLNHVDRQPFEGSQPVDFFYMYSMKRFCYYKGWTSAKNYNEPLGPCTYTERLEKVNEWVDSLPESKNRDKMRKYLNACIAWYHSAPYNKPKTTPEYRSRWKNHVLWAIGSPILNKTTLYRSEGEKNVIAKRIERPVQSIHTKEERIVDEDVELELTYHIKTFPHISNHIDAGLYSDIVKRRSKPALNPIAVLDNGELHQVEKSNLRAEPALMSRIRNTNAVEIINPKVKKTSSWVFVEKHYKPCHEFVKQDPLFKNYYAVLESVKLPKTSPMPFDLSPYKEDYELKKSIKKKNPKKGKQQKKATHNRPMAAVPGKEHSNIRKVNNLPGYLCNNITQNHAWVKGTPKKVVPAVVGMQEMANLSTKRLVINETTERLEEIASSSLYEGLKKKIGTFKFNRIMRDFIWENRIEIVK
jgi:hypothetical protein